MKIALLDGDVLAYQSASRATQKYEFGQVEDVDYAIRNIDSRIGTILDACGAKKCVIALSCPTRRYFRHKLWPDYKSRRPEKPESLAAVREHLLENYECIAKPGVEADDVLGILATWRKRAHLEQIIVTNDKDLNQIPGPHLNPDKLDAGIYDVSPREADEFHFFQTLTGDQCDGYPGCPRIGPCRARKIIDSAISDASQINADPNSVIWQRVVSAFIRAGRTEEDALVQARVARILRASDWDFEKKEPILWNPSH